MNIHELDRLDRIQQRAERHEFNHYLLQAEIDDELESLDQNLGEGEYESLDSQEAQEVVLMEIADERRQWGGF